MSYLSRRNQSFPGISRVPLRFISNARILFSWSLFEMHVQQLAAAEKPLEFSPGSTREIVWGIQTLFPSKVSSSAAFMRTWKCHGHLILRLKAFSVRILRHSEKKTDFFFLFTGCVICTSTSTPSTSSRACWGRTSTRTPRSLRHSKIWPIGKQKIRHCDRRWSTKSTVNSLLYDFILWRWRIGRANISDSYFQTIFIFLQGRCWIHEAQSDTVCRFEQVHGRNGWNGTIGIKHKHLRTGEQEQLQWSLSVSIRIDSMEWL